MVRYLPLVVKNSLRNRRRTVLTILSIGASLCLLGLLLAMYHALFMAEPTPAQALRLITHHKVSLANLMPVAYRERIKSVPGVVEVMTDQWFGGSYRDARDPKNFFARFAIEPARFFTIHPEIQLPQEQKHAFQTQRTACIAGKDLAEKFGWKLGERITIVGDIFPVTLDLTLVGIYDDASENSNLYFNQDYVYEGLPATSKVKDLAGTFQILADNPADVPRIARAVDAMFENAPEPTKTETEQAFQLSFISFLGNVKAFLFLIFGAVTFTTLLVSANTIAMSVRERIREVGILKTLGYTNHSILGIILGEATVISLLGGALGLLLAEGLAAGIRSGPAYVQSLKTMTIGPGVGALSLALAIFIGLISALIPAWNAARTSILDSLRYSG
ncbi:MAG TPA: FtsX-like permease family protein [Bryobacteraceae bacterium]|nr:FtsX-like permease family protein [Bryobacteraceae bacterium]